MPDVITGLVVAREHFSRPGSAVIVPTPAYMPFLTVPAMHGRTAIEVPMAASSARAVLVALSEIVERRVTAAQTQPA